MNAFYHGFFIRLLLSFYFFQIWARQLQWSLQWMASFWRIYGLWGMFLFTSVNVVTMACYSPSEQYILYSWWNSMCWLWPHFPRSRIDFSLSSQQLVGSISFSSLRSSKLNSALGINIYWLVLTATNKVVFTTKMKGVSSVRNCAPCLNFLKTLFWSLLWLVLIWWEMVLIVFPLWRTAWDPANVIIHIRLECCCVQWSSQDIPLSSALYQQVK